MSDIMNETISLTFGDAGENHIGMQTVGKRVKTGEGFTLQDLLQTKERFEKQGFVCELVHLNELYNDSMSGKCVIDAYLLVVREGVKYFLEKNTKGWHYAPWDDEPEPVVHLDELYKEMTSFKWDKKYYDVRRNKVLNKRARSNVCFGETKQHADYENKKGTIIPYHDVPYLNAIRKHLPSMVGPKANNMIL